MAEQVNLESGLYISNYLGENEKGEPVYDKAVGVEFIEMLFATLMSNGITASTPNGFDIRHYAGYITLEPGATSIEGKFGYAKQLIRLDVEPSDALLDRIDRIVLRLDRSNRNLYAKVIKGVASPNPVPPDYLRDQDYYDLVLFDLYRRAGNDVTAYQFTTDYRTDLTMCGIVSMPFGDINLGEYLDTLKNEFEDWFADVKGTLGENEAGELLNKINDATKRLKAIYPESNNSIIIGTNETGSTQYRPRFQTSGGSAEHRDLTRFTYAKNPETNEIKEFEQRINARMSKLPNGEYAPGVYTEKAVHGFEPGTIFAIGNSFEVEDDLWIGFDDGNVLIGGDKVLTETGEQYIDDLVILDTNLRLNSNAHEITKVGNTVTLNLAFSLTSGKTFTGTPIATLPEAVRPSGNKVCVGVNTSMVGCTAFIRSSNGDLVFRTSGAVTGEIDVVCTYTI